MLNGFRRISTLQRPTQRPRLSRCVKEELMARFWINNRPNISPGQDHTTTHRNLALNRAQCGTHICEGSDGGDRPLNRLTLKLARSKVAVINNDRGTAALKVNVGKVRELHHLLNLRRTQLVRAC
jgi:hypothetical protein